MAALHNPIMQLPRLIHPERYAGLFVVDFGDKTALGYTAQEAAMLLASSQYSQAKVYRIARADPTGRVELVGVARGSLRQQTGLFFHVRSLERAQADYQSLRDLAAPRQQEGSKIDLPCSASLALWHLPQEREMPFVVALIYPAEFDDRVSRWLLDQRVGIGELVDGGPGRLKEMQQQAEVLASEELVGSEPVRSRSLEQLLAAVDEPIQRLL
jgi:hypothetical protein